VKATVGASECSETTGVVPFRLASL